MQPGEIHVDYCPVSQSIDLLGDRWTLAVIFHVLLGRSRFTQLRAILPRIPPATLSKRLKLLVRAEIITRTETVDGQVLYEPAPAGAELYDVLYGLGVWGQRWISELITDDHIDPAKIMWEMRLMLKPNRMPEERVVVHFEFVDAEPDKTHFWMVLDREAPDLCVIDPGFGDDLHVRSRPASIGIMWMGDRTLSDLVRDGAITVAGLPRLAKELEGWIGVSSFAEVQAPDTRPRPVVGAARPL